MLFLEHLQELHLDLCSPIYSNFPQVSYLGMNSGRGWNPNLEGSYLPEYSESEAELLEQSPAATGKAAILVDRQFGEEEEIR